MYHLVHAQANRPGNALLDAVIEHFATEGLGDQSLRHIAEAVGSSHRMLLYHFGSTDGLLLAVAQAVEARTQGDWPSRVQRAGWATDDLDPRVWAYVADPELGPSNGSSSPSTAAPSRARTQLRPLLEGDVRRWLDLNVAAAGEAGIDAAPEASGCTPASAWPSCVDCCSTSWPRASATSVGAALEVFAGRYAGAGGRRRLCRRPRSAAGDQPPGLEGPRWPGTTVKTTAASTSMFRLPSAMAVAWNA